MAFSGTSPSNVILNPALDVLRGHPCASHIAHLSVGLCHTCLFSCARDIGNFFFVDHTKGHNVVVGYSIPLVTGYYRSRIAFMTTLTSCRSSRTALRRWDLRVVSLCLYLQLACRPCGSDSAMLCVIYTIRHFVAPRPEHLSILPHARNRTWDLALRALPH